jgi:Ala-tRNA(Pro) deacylase
MPIAPLLQSYLNDRNINYEVLSHRPTHTSMETAEAAHIPGDRLVKAVVLCREGGFTLAILPASCHVRLDAVKELIPGPITLASEEEIAGIFPDCEVGAIPPIGDAYGVDVIVDESLDKEDDIYFEAGDHERLIHLSAAQFHEAYATSPRATFAEHI